ncbi:MAG: hypothetical protein AAF654_09520 [Myxococcota bacterium]
MVGVAVAGGVLAAALLVLREYQRYQEQRRAEANLEALKRSLEAQQRTIRRLQEDFYVLQSVLRERNLLGANEFINARNRLIEQPKRVAAEREAIQRNLNIGVPAQVIEESLNKLH